MPNSSDTVEDMIGLLNRRFSSYVVGTAFTGIGKGALIWLHRAIPVSDPHGRTMSCKPLPCTRGEALAIADTMRRIGGEDVWPIDRRPFNWVALVKASDVHPDVIATTLHHLEHSLQPDRCTARC